MSWPAIWILSAGVGLVLFIRRQSPIWLLLPVSALSLVLSWPSGQEGDYCSIDWSKPGRFGYQTLFSNGVQKVNLSSSEGFTLGQCFTGPLTIKPAPRRSASGGFNPQSYYLANNIAGTASWHSELTLTQVKGGLSALRRQIDHRLARSAYHSYWRALLLGSRSALTDNQLALLQETQTYHLMVVSGLHITLILLITSFVVIPLPNWLKWPLLFATTLMLPWLFGGGISVWRASVMAFAATIMLVSKRSLGRSNILLFTACILVLMEPKVWLNTGAWLSFTAVIILSRLPPALSLFRVQAWLLVMLMPLTWYMGLALQPISALANLLWVPALALLLPLGVAGAFIDQIKRLDPIFSLFEGVLQLLPSAHWLPAPTWLYALPAMLSLWIWLVNVPARGLISLALLLTAFYSRPMAQQQVVALDVGQGSAVLIYDPPAVFVVDTGPGNTILLGSSGRAIAQHITSVRGLEDIYLLISHDDLDHKGGSASFLRYYPSASVILGQTVNQLVGLPCAALSNTWSWQAGEQDNDLSCVVRYTLGTSQVLITGDMSRLGEYAWLASEGDSVDLLVAGHHGSHTSTSNALLRSTMPKCVWFLAGDDNAFGHPSAEVLSKIRTFSLDFRVTGWHGELIWQKNVRNCNE